MKRTYMNLLELISQPGPIVLNQVPSMPRHLTVPSENTGHFVAVHDMFRMHAAANPDRIALSCAETGHDMTYGELDDASTLRAHSTYRCQSGIFLHLTKNNSTQKPRCHC